MYKEKPLEQLLKEKKITQNTYDKVKIVKKYIEKKYNLKTIYNMELNNVFDKINNSNLNNFQKSEIKSKIISKESEKFRHKREKISIHDYESLAIIGRGAFGEVHICRENKTGKIYAVKKIKKEVILMKNQVIHSRNEQLVMSKIKSPWIVELKASFQEDDYLFLIMEFLPGGDLMTLLIERDTFTEEEAKFYIAELICCLESIHKLDCIHRDIKPDNILIDKNGHIKLSDFGLAKVSDKLYDINNFNIQDEKKIEDDSKKKHEKNYSCVGTAYYVAPEVLNKNGYGPEVDWWSVGVIFYEMLIGYAPFCSKETSEVCQKILQWEKYLKFPKEIKISNEAKDLIKKLINSPNKRLGKNGVDEIKNHKFFDKLDWDHLRELQAPFIPELKNEYDTKYFDNFQPIEPFYPPQRKNKKRKDIEFIGYTYNNSDEEEQNDINREYIKIIDEINNINNNITTITTKQNKNNKNISSQNTYENSCVNSNENNNKNNKKYNNIVIINSKIINNNRKIVNKIKIHINKKNFSPSPNKDSIKNKIGEISYRSSNSSGKKKVNRLLIKSISEKKIKKANFLNNNNNNKKILNNKN